MSFEDFIVDTKTRAATIYELMIMGEATKRLEPDTRAALPEMPWKEIAGMRDMLIHQYEEADNLKIWNALSEGIPKVLRALEPYLQLYES